MGIANHGRERVTSYTDMSLDMSADNSETIDERGQVGFVGSKSS